MNPRKETTVVLPVTVVVLVVLAVVAALYRVGTKERVPPWTQGSLDHALTENEDTYETAKWLDGLAVKHNLTPRYVALWNKKRNLREPEPEGVAGRGKSR